MARRRFLVLFLVVAWASAEPAFAASPVSPSDGATTGASPEFVAKLANGDSALRFEVSTSPQVTIVGFADKTAFCMPTVTNGRASCSLDNPLPDGHYYWLLLYQRNTRCVTVGAKKYCFPEPYTTPAKAFTVKSASTPPPTPAPPAPAPPAPAPTPPAPQPQPVPPTDGTPPPSGVIPRPTNGGMFAYSSPEQIYSSATVDVHYVTTGLDAPPLNDDNHDSIPDYVQQIGAAADSALGYYRAHHYLPVPADRAGPDTRPDIYVKHFQSPDLYGLTLDPANAEGGTFVLVSAHLDMSPKLARGSVAITVSHELFHVVQFGYLPDGALPEWIAEGSATAASMLVYPTVDELTYADYFDEWLDQSWRPLYDERTYCDHCYGGGLWWDFLMGADPQLLPDYFKRLAAIRSTAAGFGLGIKALDDTIRARGHGSLASLFSAFSLAVYRARLQPRPTYYLTASRRGDTRREYLNGLAAHYVPVAVPAGARRLTVTVRSGSAERPRVALVLGGPKGRIVVGSSVPLMKSDHGRVMVVITSTGTEPTSYRITART